MNMFASFILALAWSIAAATSATESWRHSSPDISVSISHSGSTLIKAVMTNHGEKGYNFLSTDTFLDTHPVDKVIVMIDGTKVPTIGFKAFYTKTHIDPSRFVALDAGETKIVEFDLAETHSVHQSPHGLHDIIAQGLFHYADLNSTQLIGKVPFTSNQISVNLDLRKAADRFDAFNKRSDLTERAIIDRAHCSSSQGFQINRALQECSRQARAAAPVARSGSGNLYARWFTDRTRAAYIANRFDWIGRECTNFNDRRFTIYCRDPTPSPGAFGSGCSTQGVIAFVRSELNQLVVCAPFFNDLQTQTTCSTVQNTRAGTLVHEFLHLSPDGCSDFALERSSAQRLGVREKVLNCEQYTLFAGEVSAGCR